MQFRLSRSLLSLVSACIILFSLLKPITGAEIGDNGELYWCWDDFGTFSSGSIYESNLSNLLNSLASTTHLNDFYSTSAGNGTNTIYGRIQCRADISADDCRTCLDTAREIVNLCPFYTQAHISYDNCYLIYSGNLNITTKGYRDYDSSSEQKSDSVKKQIRTLMNNLTSMAASSTWKYSNGSSDGFYGFVQCPKNSTYYDCLECSLTQLKIIDEMNGGTQYYRYNGPSCFVRYDMTPFFSTGAGKVIKRNSMVLATGLSIVSVSVLISPI